MHARPRVDCPAHGVRQVRLPWGEPRSRFTALFERLAIDVLSETDVTGAARILRVSWDEAWGLMERAARRGQFNRLLARHSKLVVLDVVGSRPNLSITAPVALLHSPASRAIAAHLPVDDVAALRSGHPRLDDDQALASVGRWGWATNDRQIVDEPRVVLGRMLSADGYPLAAVII